MSTATGSIISHCSKFSTDNVIGLVVEHAAIDSSLPSGSAKLKTRDEQMHVLLEKLFDIVAESKALFAHELEPQPSLLDESKLITSEHPSFANLRRCFIGNLLGTTQEQVLTRDEFNFFKEYVILCTLYQSSSTSCTGLSMH